MLVESDKEQIEMLKRYWQDYGRLLLVAILVGLAAGYAWQYWHKYQLEQKIQAGSLYQRYSLLEVTGREPEAQTQLLNQLKDNYPRSAYTAFAAMLAAAHAVEAAQLDSALQQLLWVQEHTAQVSLRDLAAVRAARILLAQHQAEPSLQLLAKVAKDSIYYGLSKSVAGDAYTQLGKAAEANSAYQEAQLAYVALEVADPLLALKLSSPAPKAQPGTAAPAH